MTYSLLIKEEAVADIEEAFDFYNIISTALGQRFLTDLDQHFEGIKHRPFSFFFWLDQNRYRSFSLNRFPFSTIVEIVGNENNVFAVHDHRKHPDKSRKRF